MNAFKTHADVYQASLHTACGDITIELSRLGGKEAVYIIPEPNCGIMSLCALTCRIKRHKGRHKARAPVKSEPERLAFFYSEEKGKVMPLQHQQGDGVKQKGVEARSNAVSLSR